MEAVKRAYLSEVTPIPLPEEELPTGKIVDEHGDTIKSHGRGLMVRIDARASEKVELSKGLIAAIGFLPAFVMVLFYWGGSAIGFISNNAETRMTLQRLEQKQEMVESDLKSIKHSIQQMEIKEAEKRGFELGTISEDSPSAPKKK